jgi:membrane associated rhomboid family serine protease
MEHIWTGIKNDFRGGDTLTKLLFVNVGVFLVVNVVLYLFCWIVFGTDFLLPWNDLRDWISLPSQPGTLLFRPWTPLTYMFVHENLWHILSNMLVLYWFGMVFNDVVGGRHTLVVYLLGGLSGALFFLLYAWGAALLGQAPSAGFILRGASASVIAISVAAAATAPYYRVYLLLIGPVRIAYLAIFSVVLFLVQMPLSNTGGHFAHLGGVAFGLLFAQSHRSGWDITGRFERMWDRVASVLPSWSKTPRYRPQMNVHRPGQRPTAEVPPSVRPYRSGSAHGGQRSDTRIDQGRIDAILEKIKQSGYSSLTDSEKEYLFRASKDQP